MPAVTLPPARPVTLSRARAPFAEFLGAYRERLAHLFGARTSADAVNLDRGMPPHVVGRLREVDPLSVYVPEAYGGRGGGIGESLSVLEATGYHSLPLCLMIGINGGLFLQPVGKYAQEATRSSVFEGVIRHKRMGGLMITEPDYGSDALNMKTSWEATGRGTVRLEGTKHWAGLTGWADYWLLTARPRAADGNLRRDVDFFVADQTEPAQHVVVEEVFPNLGLRMLPYGRNRVDVELPEHARLEPHTTGVKMMLDLLHRSRLQFPGMAMGFLRRLLDEATEHARRRSVGGRPLVDYDQVRARLARMQAAVTSCAAMCLHSAETAGVETDLSGEGLKANAVKTVITDWMHEASQSLLQLVGAQGYRADHLAGRAVVDCRPFMIFEGSNDILYQQVTEAVVKAMRRVRETDLGAYLRSEPLTARAATLLGDALSFDVDWQMPQRKLVELGQAISRLVSMEMTIELGERGYAPELIAGALESVRAEVRALVETVRHGGLVALVEDAGAPDWLARVRTA